MKVKKYRVLPGQRITGRHVVYEQGEIFPEAEAVGDIAHAIKRGVIEEVKEPKKKAPKPSSETKSNGGDNGGKQNELDPTGDES